MAMVVVLLAGCGEQPRPSSFDPPGGHRTAHPTPSASTGTKPTGRATTSDTATPDDTATADDTPTTRPGDRARVTSRGTPADTTVASVTAFMRRFVRVDNHATRTGDYSVRDTLVAPSCQVCADSRRYTTRIYAAGGKIVGSLFTHPRITVLGAQRGHYFVRLDTVVSRYKAYGGDGAVVDSGPDEHQVYNYVVVRSRGRWQVVGGGTSR